MSRKLLAVIISLVLLSSCAFAYADSGYGDNNTGADNTITDTIAWLSSEVYTIDEGFVSGVTNGTSISDFVSNFYNGGENVTVNATSGVIKTGMIVSHAVSKEALPIAVKGDVNKDGLVTASDILKLSDHIIGTSNISANTVEFIAADTNSDGSITVVDVINTKKIILK